MRLPPSVLLLSAALAVGCGAHSGLVDPGSEAGLRDSGTDQPETSWDAGRNACGGSTALAATPRTACGRCGLWECDGLDAVRCDDPGVNACGECGPLPPEECNGRDDDCNGVIDEGCVRKLAWLATQDVRIQVSGDRAVFDAQGLNSNEDVVMVTISLGNVEILTPHADPIHGKGDPSHERECAIDGTWVAWVRDGGGGPGQVEALEVTTGSTFRPPAPNPAGTRPAVDAGRIVFQASPSPNDWDVWLWEPATDDIRPITAAGYHEMAPDLSGPWLVYERAPLGDEHFGRHIYALNLDTQELSHLSEGLDGWHASPAIHGNHVVWHGEQGSSTPSRRADVFHVDLLTGDREMLSVDEKAFNPRVSGSLVCWSTTNSLGPSGGIWEPGGVSVHDLATGRQREMVGDAQLCDVDGEWPPRGRVVWLERRGGLDPYVRDLLPGEP